MPEFIKDNIKGLKEEYGSPLLIGYKKTRQVDPETGRADVTTKEILVPLAIRLPNQISLEFLKAIRGTSGLDMPTGTIQILLDRDDVSSDFDLKAPETYAVRAGIKYNVLRSEVYDEAAILFAKEVGVVEPSNPLSSTLQFQHSVTVVIE